MADQMAIFIEGTRDGYSTKQVEGHNKEAMKVMAEEVYNEINNQEEPEMTIQKKSISIDNGNTFVTPEEAIEGMRWEVIAHYMEDDAREQVHSELAPCLEVEFLHRYLEVAKHDLIIG